MNDYVWVTSPTAPKRCVVRKSKDTIDEIFEAIKHGDLERALGNWPKHRVSKELTSGQGKTPLTCAAGAHQVKVCKRLLDEKLADPFEIDRTNRTALMEIAYSRRSKAPKSLLNLFKITIDAKNSSGKTALMYAVEGKELHDHGHLQLIRQLLELGADPCIRDNTGATALGIAMRQFKGINRLARKKLAKGKRPMPKMKAFGRDRHRPSKRKTVIIDFLKKAMISHVAIPLCQDSCRVIKIVNELRGRQGFGVETLFARTERCGDSEDDAASECAGVRVGERDRHLGRNALYLA